MATTTRMHARRPLLIAALLLLSYAYVLPRWADWSQTSRLALVRALIEQGTVRIDAYVDTTGDYALFEGHAYSDKAPGPALLAAPVYALALATASLPPLDGLLDRLAHSSAFGDTLEAGGGGIEAERVTLAFAHYVIVAVVVALPAALAGAVLDWLLRRWFRPQAALLGALGYGLATSVAAYAGNFYSHALVASLAIFAWALIERAADRGGNDPAGLLLGGLLLGLAIISEYPAALVAAVLGLYAMYRCGWRAAAWLTTGAVPALAALVAYDLAAFGTPWPVGYAHSELWKEQHETGFFSLTYPSLPALWGLLGGRFRGLFARAPWLSLALPGIVLWWRSGRHRAQLAVTLLAASCLILVYSASRMWWGGFAAGPRYIVAAIPFLALPAVAWLDAVWERAPLRWLGIALVIVSVALVWSEALAGQGFPHERFADPWLEWTVPAWRRQDIARNLGMALGLAGAASVLPLLLAGLALGMLLVRQPVRAEWHRAEPITAR